MKNFVELCRNKLLIKSKKLNKDEKTFVPNPLNQAERIIDRIINQNLKINLRSENTDLSDIDVPQPSIFQQESRITTPNLTSPASINKQVVQSQNTGSTLPANFASLPTAERSKIIEDFLRS